MPKAFSLEFRRDVGRGPCKGEAPIARDFGISEVPSVEESSAAPALRDPTSLRQRSMGVEDLPSAGVKWSGRCVVCLRDG